MSLILLTNDDGVNSPGLLALKDAMGAAGEVVVLAPDHNWSAAGHGKTMHKPLRVHEVQLVDGSTALATNGGPADCVALAVLGVLPRRPDLVISGINPGANVAQDMTYSGTVAAVLEALISGISGISISLATRDGGDADFGCAARFAASLALRVLKCGRSDFLLNVNVPAVPCDEIAGVEITRLGRRIYRDVLVEREDPRGHKYYWIGGEPPTGVIEDGTDFAALAANRVSVTPLQLDLTAHHVLDVLRRWQLDLR
ncbi:MAG TPA: 5'/3'-nucleotidase SurE [Anaerolineae bacterium]|nr:5'/3'-nucleotidase SurE [Anaerolineae bacterium]